MVFVGDSSSCIRHFQKGCVHVCMCAHTQRGEQRTQDRVWYKASLLTLHFQKPHKGLFLCKIMHIPSTHNDLNSDPDEC